MTINSASELSRLRWACRRGMRELDDWLLTYLDHAYVNSSVQQQQTFQQLLGYQDQEIFEWLVETAQPLDAELITMTRLIRTTSMQVANLRSRTDQKLTG